MKPGEKGGEDADERLETSQGVSRMRHYTLTLMIPLRGYAIY